MPPAHASRIPWTGYTLKVDQHPSRAARRPYLSRRLHLVPRMIVSDSGHHCHRVYRHRHRRQLRSNYSSAKYPFSTNDFLSGYQVASLR